MSFELSKDIVNGSSIIPIKILEKKKKSKKVKKKVHSLSSQKKKKQDKTRLLLPKRVSQRTKKLIFLKTDSLSVHPSLVVKKKRIICNHHPIDQKIMTMYQHFRLEEEQTLGKLKYRFFLLYRELKILDDLIDLLYIDTSLDAIVSIGELDVHGFKNLLMDVARIKYPHEKNGQELVTLLSIHFKKQNSIHHHQQKVYPNLDRLYSPTIAVLFEENLLQVIKEYFTEIKQLFQDATILSKNATTLSKEKKFSQNKGKMSLESALLLFSFESASYVQSAFSKSRYPYHNPNSFLSFSEFIDFLVHLALAKLKDKRATASIVDNAQETNYSYEEQLLLFLYSRVEFLRLDDIYSSFLTPLNQFSSASLFKMSLFYGLLNAKTSYDFIFSFLKDNLEMDLNLKEFCNFLQKLAKEMYPNNQGNSLELLVLYQLRKKSQSFHESLPIWNDVDESFVQLLVQRHHSLRSLFSSYPVPDKNTLSSDPTTRLPLLDNATTTTTTRLLLENLLGSEFIWKKKVTLEKNTISSILNCLEMPNQLDFTQFFTFLIFCLILCQPSQIQNNLGNNQQQNQSSQDLQSLDPPPFVSKNSLLVLPPQDKVSRTTTKSRQPSYPMVNEMLDYVYVYYAKKDSKMEIYQFIRLFYDSDLLVDLSSLKRVYKLLSDRIDFSHQQQSVLEYEDFLGIFWNFVAKEQLYEKTTHTILKRHFEILKRHSEKLKNHLEPLINRLDKNLSFFPFPDKLLSQIFSLECLGMALKRVNTFHKLEHHNLCYLDHLQALWRCLDPQQSYQSSKHQLRKMGSSGFHLEPKTIFVNPKRQLNLLELILFLGMQCQEKKTKEIFVQEFDQILESIQHVLEFPLPSLQYDEQDLMTVFVQFGKQDNLIQQWTLSTTCLFFRECGLLNEKVTYIKICQMFLQSVEKRDSIISVDKFPLSFFLTLENFHEMLKRIASLRFKEFSSVLQSFNHMISSYIVPSARDSFQNLFQSHHLFIQETNKNVLFHPRQLWLLGYHAKVIQCIYLRYIQNQKNNLEMTLPSFLQFTKDFYLDHFFRKHQPYQQQSVELPSPSLDEWNGLYKRNDDQDSVSCFSVKQEKEHIPFTLQYPSLRREEEQIHKIYYTSQSLQRQRHCLLRNTICGLNEAEFGESLLRCSLLIHQKMESPEPPLETLFRIMDNKGILFPRNKIQEYDAMVKCIHDEGFQYNQSADLLFFENTITSKNIISTPTSTPTTDTPNPATIETPNPATTIFYDLYSIYCDPYNKEVQNEFTGVCWVDLCVHGGFFLNEITLSDLLSIFFANATVYFSSIEHKILHNLTLDQFIHALYQLFSYLSCYGKEVKNMNYLVHSLSQKLQQQPFLWNCDDPIASRIYLPCVIHLIEEWETWLCQAFSWASGLVEQNMFMNTQRQENFHSSSVSCTMFLDFFSSLLPSLLSPVQVETCFIKTQRHAKTSIGYPMFVECLCRCALSLFQDHHQIKDSNKILFLFKALQYEMMQVHCKAEKHNGDQQPIMDPSIQYLLEIHEKLLFDVFCRFSKMTSTDIGIKYTMSSSVFLQLCKHLKLDDKEKEIFQQPRNKRLSFEDFLNILSDHLFQDFHSKKMGNIRDFIYHFLLQVSKISSLIL